MGTPKAYLSDQGRTWQVISGGVSVAQGNYVRMRAYLVEHFPGSTPMMWDPKRGIFCYAEERKS